MTDDDTLTSFEAALQTAIEGLSKGDGYNYDWGTVNQPDEALQTFPSAEVTLVEEKCLDAEGGVWSRAYDLEATYMIRVRARIDNETMIPSYEINAELNKALQDLKKLFGTNYHMSNHCDTIQYAGATRVPDKNGDIFRPTHMDVKIVVTYTEDREDPGLTAE